MNATFLFDQQWCMIHYPEQPNGFAIFIIGDQQHFVNEETSFWVQHTGRAKMIEDLTNAGYIVYYSNLHGRNWGNDKSVQLSHMLYHHVIRKEILNNKIHVLAEGMGSLTAIKLIPLMKEHIRSLVLYSPCISLSTHIQQEKNRIFFYKKLLKEIQHAYKITDHEADTFLDSNEGEKLKETTQSLCFIHVIDQKRYEDQKPLMKEIVKSREEHYLPMKTFYILLENRTYITAKIIHFLNENEKEL